MQNPCLLGISYNAVIEKMPHEGCVNPPGSSLLRPESGSQAAAWQEPQLYSGQHQHRIIGSRDPIDIHTMQPFLHAFNHKTRRKVASVPRFEQAEHRGACFFSKDGILYGGNELHCTHFNILIHQNTHKYTYIHIHALEGKSEIKI